METEPYRKFKELLDRIINIRENLKEKLVVEFEKKRLNNEEETLETSLLDSIFSKKERD